MYLIYISYIHVFVRSMVSFFTYLRDRWSHFSRISYWLVVKGGEFDSITRIRLRVPFRVYTYFFNRKFYKRKSPTDKDLPCPMSCSRGTGRVGPGSGVESTLRLLFTRTLVYVSTDDDEGWSRNGCGNRYVIHYYGAYTTHKPRNNRLNKNCCRDSICPVLFPWLHTGILSYDPVSELGVPVWVTLPKSSGPVVTGTPVCRGLRPGPERSRPTDTRPLKT